MNLTAVFKVKDQGTAMLRKLTQSMDSMNRSNRIVSEGISKTQKSVSQLGSTATSASSKLGGFSTQVSSLRVGTNGLSASLKGAQSALVGIAGAYVGANGAAKLFNATIGAAANYEQSEVAVKAIFNDDKASSEYLKMVQKKAIASPLLNSNEMLSSSKTLVAMTKNVDDLGKAWSIIERLMVLDPTQGTDGAAFALKEMWQGDSLSMVERFGLDKKKLNEIKKMAIPKQISEINKMLDGMGITQKTVDAMGDTTKGLWAQLGEKSRTFFKDIGMESNTKLGEFLRRLNKMFDGIDTKAISDKLGGFLGQATDKAIALYDIFVKWRKEIAYAAGAIATFVAALAVVGTISALANPISLIAMGIAAAAVGFKALYDNSKAFRGVINGIIGAFKAVSEIFKNGLKGYGTARSLLEEAGLNEGQIQSVIKFAYSLKDAFAKVKSVFSGIGTLVTGGSSLNLLTALGFSPETAAKVDGQINGIVTKISEFITNVKSKFGEVKDYIAEKITQLQPTFDRLKEIFSTVWSTLVSVLTNAWTIIEPYLSGFWNILQVLGDVAMVVFNNVILPAISFLAQLFSTLWSIAQPILTGMGLLFELMSTIVKRLWDNILVPFIDFITTAAKNAFDNFAGALKIVQGWFETLSGWVSTAYGHVKDFIGFIGKAKLPDWVTNGVSAGVNFVGNIFSGGKGGKPDGSHYHGLDAVPYNGYVASMHKGEKILTAQEAKAYDEGKGGGSYAPVINIAKMEVRQDSDIQKVAFELAKLIEKEASAYGI